MEQFRALAEKSEPVTIDEIYDLVKDNDDARISIALCNESIIRVLQCAKINDYRYILLKVHKASVQIAQIAQDIDRKNQDEIQAKIVSNENWVLQAKICQVYYYIPVLSWWNFAKNWGSMHRLQ